MLVSTMLTDPERRRVDAVGMGAYELAHRDSIDEVMTDVRGRHAKAVVISVACCQSSDIPRIEGRLVSIVRDFPRVTALGLLSGAADVTPSAMLLLGRSGIRTVVDARSPDGWRVLREALTERSHCTDIAATAIAQISEDLGAASEDCRRFFATLFTVDDSVFRVGQLGRVFAVEPSTLISRFARAGLPSPKTYLSWARLVKAAALLENPGLSLARAAMALEYSSPQALARHLRLYLSVGGPVFRRSYDGARMLARFRRDLVLAHIEVLRWFSPFGGHNGGVGGPGSGEAHPKFKSGG
jgi:AraC-like DNA-binding protein